uniref:Uncharacterized protein n=1 Tax=Chromera velia CCMP2878 TaxID=1169474 RepID=A0A0G4HMQ7_9ALVE|eukprot:Cvel_29248.t1-p1 / transcript=Cvel_29248.t1 / gene=Cvel_29248 / organism=Chromera_velia_CCMP2878 / gene_product=H/ACA ribonucleoprotein complex subunit 4, putative / transcript_product=H/ACA ribonucleoprotein complex subunit 4, putative / location=Cvel_scaffold3965:976-2205(-) / protein_length=410 / sequence_SO=supercontig / SO=protein_coding / is_pseudo=false
MRRRLVQTDSSEWPLLLRNYHELNIRPGHYTPSPKYGCTPPNRPLGDYVSNGVIVLDKPSGPSSHEVVSWVKKFVECERAVSIGTLEPRTTGCLLVCLDRSTRLHKTRVFARSFEYVVLVQLHAPLEPQNDPQSSSCRPISPQEQVSKALESLRGEQLQRVTPVISKVQRQLRLRRIHKIELIEYSEKKNHALISVSCEAATSIRTICIHLGILLGCGAHVHELRCIRSGCCSENRNLSTMHDVLDACHLSNTKEDESYLRRVILPLEYLLTHLPRIVLKDSAVNAICHGAVLKLVGVLRYESRIEAGSEVVLMTTKGEAVAVAFAEMSTASMATASDPAATAARVKRVIMDRNVYPLGWGFGSAAVKRRRVETANPLLGNELGGQAGQGQGNGVMGRSASTVDSDTPML